MRKKVAIIGANSTVKYAPLDDPEWEIWGCNSLWRYAMNRGGEFKATRWFELHPMDVQTEAELKAIAECPVPIYTLKDESSWAPFSRVYPLEDVMEKLPWRYFTCTFAYQIALAIKEGFSTIGLFGVELWQGTPRERFVERACVEFWIGVAAGMKIDFVLPEGTRMAYQNPLYGYDYHTEMQYVNQQLDALVYGYANDKGWIAEEDAVQPVFLREGHE